MKCKECGSTVKDEIIELDGIAWSAMLEAHSRIIRHADVVLKNGDNTRGIYIEGRPSVIYVDTK